MSRFDLSVGFVALFLGNAALARAESPPAPPRVNISNVVVQEGDSGQTPFTAQVSLDGYYGSVTVKVTAAPGTASETDYSFTTTQVTLTYGGPSQTVSGFIVGDLDPEGDEYFTLTAIAIAGAYPSYLYSSGGTITIQDDDQARASRLHVEGAILLEGDQGVTTAELNVKLEPASQSTVTVAYKLEPVTASPGIDYRDASGTLTFAPGEVLKIIPVDIFGDTTWETDESFAVVLSQPKAALLGTARAEVVIANDDAPSHLSIADMEVTEGNDGVKSVPITIEMDHPAPPFMKVHVWLVGGAAVAGEDFQSFFQVLYPQEGTTQTTFTIGILSDRLPECDEGLFIHYLGMYAGDETERVARLLIRNDDGPADNCTDPFVPIVTPTAPLDGGQPAAPDAQAPVTIPDADIGPTTSTPSLDGGQAASLDAQALPLPTEVEAPGLDGGASSPRPVDRLAAGGCSITLGPSGRGLQIVAGAIGLFVAVWWRRLRRST